MKQVTRLELTGSPHTYQDTYQDVPEEVTDRERRERACVVNIKDAEKKLHRLQRCCCWDATNHQKHIAE